MIVCRLSKRCLYFAINEKGFTAEVCAKLVSEQTRRLGAGVISSFVSDKEIQWDNEFWTHLCRIWKIKKKMSTAFHPKTDGQSEITNQKLERYLRNYCDFLQNDWNEWLINAEVAKNSLPSESTKLSPFFVTNGFDPIHPFDLGIEKDLPKVSRSGQKERNKALAFA